MFDRDLIRCINSGRCFVLIGSGPSTEIGYPSWSKLAEGIWEEVKKTNPEADERSFNKFMQDELYPEALRQAEVDFNKNRTEFVNLAHKVFTSLHQTRSINNPIYTYLAQWPFACYLTTNYDDEIYNSLKNHGEYFLVRGNDNDDFSGIRDGITNLIIKIHSDFSCPEKIILTSVDYEACKNDNRWDYYRTHLRRIFETFDLLIIGHGMKDPDLQQMLSIAKTTSLPSHPIYMIIADMTEGEKRELYERYNIRTVSYNNTNKNHDELKRILQITNKFIATRGNTQPQIQHVTEDDTINATSLFLYRTLSTFGSNEQMSVVQIMSPIILRILNNGLALSIDDIHTIMNEYFNPIDINHTTECCEQLINHNLLLNRNGLLTLSIQGKNEISQIENVRKIEEDQAYGQIKMKISDQYPNILPEDVDMIVSTLKQCIVAFFQNRGISAAAVIIGKEREGGVIKTDIFQELYNASTILRSELKGPFLDIGGDLFLNPSEPQQKYLASLAQGFFLYHMAGLDPSCSRIRKDFFSETAWILDSSVILQYLAIGCAGYDYTKSLFEILIDAKATLYITNRLLLEVQRHLKWAKELVSQYGVESSVFRDAALAKGFKQNLFIDGYIRLSAKGEIGSFEDYLKELKLDMSKVSISNIQHINICEICNDPKILSNMKAYQNEIAEKRKQRNTFRHDQQCEAEAEVIALIEYFSATEPSKRFYFVSQSHLLNDIGKEQTITWSPEMLYRYVCSLPAVKNDPSLFQQCLLDTFYNSGITIIDQKQYRRFFGVAIDQAKIQFEKEKQRFIDQLEDSRISIAELDEAFEKTPDLEKPIFVQQMGWTVARCIEKEVEKQQEKLKQSESEQKLARKKLRQMEHEKEQERKQRITAEQKLAQIRNEKDLKHLKKRRRQAMKRRKK